MSRTIGDIEAKLPIYKGKPIIIIFTPEINSFKIESEHDFLVLGSDGIFDKLENREVINLAWKAVDENKQKFEDENILCGLSAELILKGAICKRTLDNVTVIMICFKNLSKQNRIEFCSKGSSQSQALLRNDSLLPINKTKDSLKHYETQLNENSHNNNTNLNQIESKKNIAPNMLVSYRIQTNKNKSKVHIK